MPLSKSKYLIVLFALLLITGTSKAQIPSTGGGAERSEKNFNFLPIPYLNYSRSIGFSYGLLPMAMYNLSKKDTISPSSVSGMLGMGSDNGTWFGMAFNKFYLKEDTYRLTLVGGLGNVNFQFYPDLPFAPEFIKYSTGMDFLLVEGQRKVAKNMYAGLGYFFVNLSTQFDIDGVPTQYNTLHGIRLVYSADFRDNVYYPHKGFIANLQYNAFPSFLGNTSSSNKIEVDWNHFFEMKNKKDVVAARAFIGVGIGKLDFNQQFIVGQTDIRGYSQGKFRGDQLYAIQAEYRKNFNDKFGIVGFAGVATIGGSINESDNGRFLPSAGGGFRITVFPKNHFNIGMDAGVGVDDWGLEFRIGEAF